MINKYYINIQLDEINNAGSKAVNDCNQILKNNGVKPYTLNIKKSGNKYLSILNKMIEFEKIKKIEKNSLLFVPHPIYINKKYYIDILKKAKEKRNLKLVFLIHDLDSLRKMFPESDKEFKHIDDTMYGIADYVIAHNRRMKDYLIDKGVSPDKIYELGIFDYLTDCETESKTIKYAKTLNIAGSLDTGKCKYIKELNNLKKDIQVNLYGPNYDENVLNSESIHYKGKFPSDEIPYLLDEGFGLVWDGDGINGCSGNTGEYLRYNNPHKLSLYMVSGLPVVIWSKAAEAEFVINNKVGVVVNDINDFNDVFDKIDEKTYYEMVENTRKISEKMRNGKYLEQVVNDILTTL